MAIAKKTGSAGKRVHVISREKGWAVKSEGTARAYRIYSRKDAAVKGARKLSKARDVVVHRRDGSIQKWEKSGRKK